MMKQILKIKKFLLQKAFTRIDVRTKEEEKEKKEKTYVSLMLMKVPVEYLKNRYGYTNSQSTNILYRCSAAGIISIFYSNVDQNRYSDSVSEYVCPLGPVQKQVSLTLGLRKIQSKFSKSLFVILKIFFHKSCLDRLKFSFIKF